MVHPFDTLIPNGEVQSFVLGSYADDNFEGGRTELPLSLFSPVQSKEDGFTVGGKAADLLAVMQAGNFTLGVIDLARENGYSDDYTYDNSRFVLAKLQMAGEKGKNVFRVQVDGAGQEITTSMFEPETSFVLGGGSRTRQSAAFLQAAKSSRMLSERHMLLNFTEEGSLSVVDLGSKNGTEVLVRPTNDPDRILTQDEVRDLENTIMRRTQYGQAIGNEVVAQEAQVVPFYEQRESASQLPEFMIGTVRYALKGAVEMGARDAFLFTTTDDKGIQRDVLVYRSNSEGSLRVSQGMERFKNHKGEMQDRIMKGGELSVNSQYTQDTQLHTQFERQMEAILTLPKSSIPSLDEAVLAKDTQEADRLYRDFERETTTYRLGSPELYDALKSMRPGAMSRDELATSLGLSKESTTEQIDAAMMRTINSVNRMLIQEGLLPDFANPVRTEVTQHPLMGQITKEVFQKTVGGRLHEWVVGSTADGSRVWIDRIHFGDTTSTPYGTDREMLFSGFLTSKPLEHAHQTTGISEDLKKQFNRHYVDITPFIGMFEPVARYKQARRMGS